MTSLDYAINSELLVVSKSLVPYLEIQHQKPIAILIKVIELIATINLYSDIDAVLEMSHTQEPGWEKDFLKDVKENLDTDKAYLVDTILKVIEAKDLIADSSFNLAQLFAPTTSAVVAPTTVTTSTSTTPTTIATPSTTSTTALTDILSSILDTNGVQLLSAIAMLLKNAEKPAEKSDEKPSYLQNPC